jgi:hypothetical protein
VCGRDLVEADDYIELTAHIPGQSATQRNGAHVTCVQPLFHPTVPLDIDGLMGR